MNKVDSILVIDDDDINNFVTYKVLSNMHLTDEIKIAKNGKEGLKALQAQNNQMQIIFLDLNMPEMDGFAFLKAYQKSNIPNKENTYIVVLSCISNFDDIQKLSQYKIDGFISKPLTEKNVSKILKKFN